MSVLLFIPGLLSDGRVWQAHADAFPEFGTALIPDLTEQSSLVEMARDSLAMTSGQSIVVAGQSMGARVALEIYRLAPDRVKGLALYDTGVHALKEGEVEKREAIVKLAHEQGMQALAAKWLPLMLHPQHRTLPSIYEPLEDMVLAKTPAIHERQIRALIGRADATPLLPAITCPVLLAVGAQDFWAPPAQHQEMQRHLNAPSTLEVIEGAGHFAPFEQPAASISIMRRWLEKIET